jgi:hypothetical protein
MGLRVLATRDDRLVRSRLQNAAKRTQSAKKAEAFISSLLQSSNVRKES